MEDKVYLMTARDAPTEQFERMVVRHTHHVRGDDMNKTHIRRLAAVLPTLLILSTAPHLRHTSGSTSKIR